MAGLYRWLATRLNPGALGPLVLPAACCLILLLVYAWFISIGTWDRWPTKSTTYDQLASAFARGETWIAEKPDPRLLALPDPYDPLQRTGIPYPLDFSLYHGHFYLYFGPAPALLLLVTKLFVPGIIGDQYIVFAFMAGIAILQSALILKIQRRFFPSVPTGLVVITVLALGLTGPYTLSLLESNFYVVAVAAGAFFFLAGLCTALTMIDGPVSGTRLVLTGLLWGAAIASRLTQAVPVAVMLSLILVWFLRDTKERQPLMRLARPFLFITAPLVVIGLLLAWYNWARFGSVFEIGLRYALAGPIPMLNSQGQFFSWAYIPRNLYNYVLSPLAVYPSFPFVDLKRGLPMPLVPWLAMAHIRTSEPISGLLFTTPLAALGLVPVIRLLRGSDPDRSLRRLNITLTAASAVPFGILLCYFWSAERFIIDFLPPLILLSTIGLWQIYTLLSHSRYGWLAFAALCVVLILAPMVVSFLVTLSTNIPGFRALNPDLWRQLKNLTRQ